MTGNEDLTVQFGEDPPWDDLPPVDREKANKELESRTREMDTVTSARGTQNE